MGRYSADIKSEFERKLCAGDLMFFAGSGICVPSEVPSASEILDATAKLFLPYRHPLVKSVVSTIQPEVLYERLLELTGGNRKRLALWRLLSLPFRPNINHRFITHYSYEKKVPIFTTNFDELFEKGASQLNISVKIFERPKNFDEISLNFENLNLLKLHGTIGQDPELTGIYTTMTEISRFNEAVVEYLQKEMERKSLVIVGYSGRDLDHFPFIRDKSKRPESREVFWINDFKKEGKRSAERVDYYNALQIGQNGARIIPTYPGEYFRQLPYTKENGLDKEDYVSQEYCREIKKIKRVRAPELTREAIEGLGWGSTQKSLFLGSLLEAIGKFRTSQRVLNRVVHGGKLNELTDIQKSILMRCLCSDVHNLSEFTVLEKYSNQLTQSPISNTRLRALFQITGMIFEAEYRRMLVPYMSFIYNDFATKLYRELLLESYRYNVKVVKRIRDIIKNKELGRGLDIRVDEQSSESIFQIHTQQQILEHRIRTLSIEQQIVKDLLCLPEDSIARTKAVSTINKEWDKLCNICYHKGYYAGTANCHRHKDRTVIREEELEEDIGSARHIAKVANLETTRHLINQQEIEFYMRCGNVNRLKVNESKIKELLKDSLSLENYLNALKSFLALLEFDRIRQGDWNFKDEFKRRANQLNGEFNGGIERTLHTIKKYNPIWHHYLCWLKNNNDLVNVTSSGEHYYAVALKKKLRTINTRTYKR